MWNSASSKVSPTNFHRVQDCIWDTARHRKNLPLSRFVSEKQALTWGATRSRGSLNRFTWWRKKQGYYRIFTQQTAWPRNVLCVSIPLLMYWALLYYVPGGPGGPGGPARAGKSASTVQMKHTQKRENCCYGATTAMETLSLHCC